MNSPEIRWIQLFDNFKRAYAQLRKAAVLAGEWKLTELERQGLIQAFSPWTFSAVMWRNLASLNNGWRP